MSVPDAKAVPSEPSTANLAKSLEERLTIPDKNPSNAPSAELASQKFNWADEVTTPIAEANGKSEDSKDGKLSTAQVDGSTEWLGGSHGLDEPEFDVNVKLADLQDDPNNPLYSVKAFHELNLRTELVTGLECMDFSKPSKIQERALPLLLKDPPQNFIGQSQSGTGKTAAFVLNMLQRVDLTSMSPQCLVLAPTRELAKQISGVAKLMGTFLIEKGLVITEVIPNPQKRNQKFEGQILVGTPGSTMDMLRRKLIDASALKVFTLDEADNMLALQGLGDQCKRVRGLIPNTVQVVLFSATFPEDVLQFANSFAPKANTITLQVESLTVKGIKQMYLDCDNDEEKYSALVKFYGLMTIASSIIFVKRRDTALEIQKRMTAEGHQVAQISGALDPAERDEVFQRFRSGKAKVLIATNVLSRGIDVQTVTMVINYDIPDTAGGKPDYETYLHRIGRTGRFGRTGAALSFVHDKSSWEMLMAICKHFGVEPTRLDTQDWDNTERQLKLIMKNARNALAQGNVGEDASMAS